MKNVDVPRNKPAPEYYYEENNAPLNTGMESTIPEHVVVSSKKCQTRNFETNMFCVRAASSILVRLLATWSAVRLPTKRDRYFPIFGVINLWRSLVSSIYNHGGLSFLHLLWYILIEKRNFETNMF